MAIASFPPAMHSMIVSEIPQYIRSTQSIFEKMCTRSLPDQRQSALFTEMSSQCIHQIGRMDFESHEWFQWQEWSLTWEYDEI